LNFGAKTVWWYMHFTLLLWYTFSNCFTLGYSQ